MQVQPEPETEDNLICQSRLADWASDGAQPSRGGNEPSPDGCGLWLLLRSAAISATSSISTARTDTCRLRPKRCLLPLIMLTWRQQRRPRPNRRHCAPVEGQMSAGWFAGGSTSAAKMRPTRGGCRHLSRASGRVTVTGASWAAEAANGREYQLYQGYDGVPTPNRCHSHASPHCLAEGDAQRKNRIGS